MTDKEFEDKFLTHRSLLRNYLKSKYTISNEELEDVIQNAYVKIYKRFKNNDLECEYPRQYLFSSAVNCLKEYKTRKPQFNNEFTFTESNVDCHEAFLDLVNSIDFSQVPHSLCEKKIISEELKKLFDKLDEMNPEMSQALKMFYFDEMQANEISEKLNIPINTIKTRLHRGRNKVRSLIKEDMVLSPL